MHNLYGQKDYEAVTQRMMAKLKELQRQYDDPIDK